MSAATITADHDPPPASLAQSPATELDTPTSVETSTDKAADPPEDEPFYVRLQKIGGVNPEAPLRKVPPSRPFVFELETPAEPPIHKADILVPLGSVPASNEADDPALWLPQTSRLQLLLQRPKEELARVLQLWQQRYHPAIVLLSFLLIVFGLGLICSASVGMVLAFQTKLRDLQVSSATTEAALRARISQLETQSTAPIAKSPTREELEMLEYARCSKALGEALKPPLTIARQTNLCRSEYQQRTGRAFVSR